MEEQDDTELVKLLHSLLGQSDRTYLHERWLDKTQPVNS